MLRHTTFAIVSLLACGVASAQQPLAPYFNYGGVGSNSGVNCPNGFCGTGNCASGNCATGNCATGTVRNGNYGNNGMICGPNGCYAPGTAPGSVYPYQSNRIWPYSAPLNQNYRSQPVYSVPSSSYPGFPNIPSAYRNRHLPTTSGFPTYRAPVSGNWHQYPATTGASHQYGDYTGPSVLY